jgi:SNF2 family DNA or RNA helicase
LYAMKVGLRNHLHIIRSMGKELCGRVRSLRYVEWIHKFQIGSSVMSCVRCSKTNFPIHSMGVLSCCGHVGCLECLEVQSAAGTCIMAPLCSARVSPAHVVSSRHLGLDRAEDASGGQFGRKLTEIVDKVKEIIATGDRLIIFCQFDDLTVKVVDALESRKIVALQVQGSVQKKTKTLSVFQKDKPDASDPRVLLLKMDDEQSAGLNLTNLNHAIFVHPLLAANQAEYEAYETQAIGRIRRYGKCPYPSALVLLCFVLCCVVDCSGD